jgi:hypothetical protein
MGRSMIIVVMGVMLTIGITQTSIFSTMGSMDQKNVNYAENIQAANIAHTAAEMAMRQLRDNPNWRTQSWEVTSNGGTAIVSVVTVDSDTLRVTSTGSINDQTHTVNYTILESPFSLVPQFNAAMGIYTDNFIFNIDGAAGRLDGNDVSGECETVPGVGVNSETAKTKVGKWSNIKGDPNGEAGILEDTHEWDDVQKLIDALAPSATKVTKDIKDFGSKENPGVFVVDSKVRLAGGVPTGYGILIVRSGGELELEGDLTLTGNFEFNGLVIFENAYNLDARGTPTINGSIMIGGNTDFDIPIHIRGNVSFNYDCSAQDLADRAYMTAGASMRFTTLSIFE